MKIWVTKNNQVWAAQITGLSATEIEQRYKEARETKSICTIELPELDDDYEDRLQLKED